MRGFVALYGLCFALGAYGAPSSSTVDLGYAKYQGVPNAISGNLQFLGVRYAAPPTGNLRWREPQQPKHESGVKIADTQPNKCYQAFPATLPMDPISEGGSPSSLEARQASDPSPVESEDCLFLNVYTPGVEVRSGAKLPVIFWIHGGGYILGSVSGVGFGAGGPYDGTELLKRAGGKAIVVTIQHRLGVFGFLSSSNVKQGGALNAGLLDQEFAMKWVQQHIHKFGGDPSQVTIWGESAGAGSVFQHLIAHGGNTQPPLFKSAITSSLFQPSQYAYNHSIPEALYSQVVSAVECSASPVGDTMKCLREADISKLQSANLHINGGAFIGTFAFLPVIDGSFIKEPPSQAVKKGKLNSKRILAMTNGAEGVLFVPQDIPADFDVANYIKKLFPTASTELAAATAAQYSSLGSSPEQVLALYAEVIFLCPTYALLKQLNGKGYKGTFDPPPALHGDELSYLFPGLTTAPLNFDNPMFAQALVQAFTDFALSGNPNVKKDPTSILPNWPQWSASSPNEMSFNRTGDSPNIAARLTDPALLQRCQFWSDNAQAIAQ